MSAESREDLAARITSFTIGHDKNIRAAVWLTCNSVLLPKIGPYVDADGWVAWDRLAADMIDGSPWSSGEKRLARLACSLSGQIAYLADERRTTDLFPWGLDELLYGLSNLDAALAAIRYAATGVHPDEAGAR